MKVIGLHRRLVLIGIAVLALAAVAAGPAAAGGGPTTCTGSLAGFPSQVGMLQGTYDGNVQISGACAAMAGPVVVNGNLTVLSGSTLLAAFGSASLTVTGNVDVKQGGTLIGGCYPTSFPCFDDMAGPPSLSSPFTVGGNLTANQPLGVIVHDGSIGGNVTENGGGGGVSCTPPDGSFFGVLGFPAYSDYEDSTVGGNLDIHGVGSCWLGVARVHVGRNLTLNNNQLADPDAIEVIANTVGGNLDCHQNSMVWDSADLSDSGLYPRAYLPNTVGGNRGGQCVIAPAIDAPGGVSPGTF